MSEEHQGSLGATRSEDAAGRYLALRAVDGGHVAC